MDQEEHMTGRVIFNICEYDEDEFTFMCGAEVDGCYFYDQEDDVVCNILEKLFNDVNGFIVEAAESLHIINLDEAGMDWIQAEKLVESRLLSAGAHKSKQ